MSTGLLVAVPAALGASASFGTAGVLQHRATHETRESKPLRPRLLLDLVRLSAFRSGVMLGALGFALQVTALRFGPLILVQPILVTGVLFYLLVASLMGRRRPDRMLLLGTLMALAGLSCFLLVARPSAAHGQFQSSVALPLGIGLVVVVAGCLAVAARIRSEIRSLPLAVATAVCYGVTAALVRSLTSAGGGLFQHWELYAVAVVGPAGFLLNQNAFQSGTVGSLALATITVGDPLVAIALGVAWLGEDVSGTGAAVAGEVVSLAVMATGVFLLAGRAQHLATQLRAAGRLPEESS